MKPTEITMQIVKNIAMFETVRLQATYTLDDNDDLTQAFVTARQQLETAFAKAYGLKPELTLKSARFESICNALFQKRATLAQIENSFRISDEAMDYFNKHDLI